MLHLRSALCFLLASLFLSSALAVRSRVVISAKASDSFQEYDLAREDDDPIRYIMVEGKFFGGAYRDKGLETYEFSEIAESVVAALKKQNYQVTFDKDQCDLVVMVSWGISVVEVDESEDWGFDSIEEMQEVMTGGEEGEMSVFRPSNYERMDENRSMKLMGFDDALDRNSWIVTQETVELASSLKSERYFLIVSAFEAQPFIAGERPVVAWITRYSVDAKRLKFPDAVAALNHAASGYFGKSSKKLLKAYVDDGDVKAGELEVVETVGESDNR